MKAMKAMKDMKEVPIQDVMTTEVITVNENAAVSEVVAIFDSHDFHHLIVVNSNDVLQGVISRTDLDQTKSGATLFNNPLKEEHDAVIFASMLALEIMTPNVLTLNPKDSIRRAFEIFQANKFRALPIVNVGKVVGIITPLDLLEHCFNS